MRRLFLILIFFLTTSTAFGVTEFSLNAGYDKQFYGDNKQGTIISKTYSGSLAFYFWQNVAFELNYSQTEDSTSQTYQIDSTQAVSITKLENNVFTKIYGAGFRIALAGKRSRIVPMLSLGYAKQFVENTTVYSLYTKSDGSTTPVTYSNPEETIESVFGSFILQFKITQRFTLKASVKTVFKAFEFSQAKDYLKYLVGFSWYL